MDAVSARDHAMEVAAACAIAMVHLSRLAEELVLWSSAEFRLVRLSEAYATGGSIMPQKRNPDAPELIRGKTGRVVGDLTALLTLVKGLPMAYDRDLQEDREALFDAVLTPPPRRRSRRAACPRSPSPATASSRAAGRLPAGDRAGRPPGDPRGPFREAHHVVGRIVADCEARGTDLAGLDLAALRTFHPDFGDDALQWLDPRRAAERRTSFGGTAPGEIDRQVALLRAR
ncbi:MAG: lyase family protein [Myxococcota bacterium]